MGDDANEPVRVDTTHGPVQYRDEGEGAPLLFIHGSPGGCDQGSLMTRFLRDQGWRTIALSRPGYLETPLTDANRTPDAQAALAGALMDALGLEQFALMCWSGGGPSSYRLAATEADRVTSLVAVAAVSSPYEFHDVGEAKLLLGHFGKWLMKEMVRHAPKSTVKMLAKEEGDLTKDQIKKLTEAIWDDPIKRQFALDLMVTVAGDRKDGFENDVDQFKQLDLDLGNVRASALLVHAKTDRDVPLAQSENASAELPNADLVTIDEGTHVSVWTDPDNSAIQGRIASFLIRP